MVGVGVPRLEGEDGRVGGCVQLHHGLHREGAVYEVRRLVVDVAHVDYDSLVVGVCEEMQENGETFEKWRINQWKKG